MFRATSCCVIFTLVVLVGNATIHAAVVTIEGTIKSIDAKKRTITIETGAKSRTLDVGSKAKISVGDKDAALDSLKTGQKVKLSYHENLEIVLKIDVTQSNPKGGDEIVFDGKTLKGWKGNTKHWKVVNGVIVGKLDRPIDGGSFLIYEKPFEDFELHLKFNLLDGNSGVQIRSKEHPNYIVSGHQADIAYGNFKWMGVLGGEKIKPAQIAMTSEAIQETLRKTVKQDDWNDMTIVVKGSSVRIDVNGITTVDAVDPKIPKTGVIALQLHGGKAMEVMFKDIEIKKLP